MPDMRHAHDVNLPAYRRVAIDIREVAQIRTIADHEPLGRGVRHIGDETSPSRRNALGKHLPQSWIAQRDADRNRQKSLGILLERYQRNAVQNLTVAALEVVDESTND
ncbi:MAG: hypothetical protein NW215_00835 [Hyphomicrobiales bacterium]|nr:hypothetical protein [Hyphomicrobiales bacterium]